MNFSAKKRNASGRMFIALAFASAIHISRTLYRFMCFDLNSLLPVVTNFDAVMHNCYFMYQNIVNVRIKIENFIETLDNLEQFLQ